MITNKNFPSYTRLVLENGLTVLLYPMEKIYSCYAILYVKVGGVYEKIADKGISHFTEHLPFLGTEKYPTPLVLSQEAENLGAHYNGGTSRFNTNYHIKFPRTNLEKSLEILKELVFFPLLRVEDLEKEKSVIISEHDDFWHNPDKRFGYEFWQRRFKNKNHPYSFRVGGTPETIKKIDRDKILAWRKKYYNPANMTLSIAGNFSEKEIQKIIKKDFSTKTDGIKAIEPEISVEGYSDFNFYHKKDIRPQIKFYISFPAFGWKPESRKKELTAVLLSHILGRGPASRLFQRIREKERLVYRIGTDLTLYPYLGDFGITGSVSNNNLVSALKLVKEEIDHLFKDGVENLELNLSRNSISASILMRFDNSEGIAHYFAGEEMDYGEIWLPEKYIAEYKKITKKEIHEIAQQIFNYKKINIGLLGSVSPETEKEIQNIFQG